jgi:restriction endonuclease S subunit
MIENDVNISIMLNGRFDFAINRYNQSINNFLFPTCKLSDLLLINPKYGANESGIERKTFLEPRYIRITDIDKFEVLNTSIGVTAATIEKKYFLENDDIIIARSGATVGKSYIYKKAQQEYPCFFAGYMIRFRVNTGLILPDYFFVYTQLNFYKQWTAAIQRTTGQPNINAEEYKSIKIPLPPKEIQQLIVDLYNRAMEEKQAKEQEAIALLAGIDNYLLKELGIELPENTGNERYFEVSIQDLIGGRLDPMPYNVKCKTLRRMIQNSHLAKLRLKDIIIHSIAGDWGVDETEILNEECSKCLVIRSTEFDNKYNLNLDNSRVKFRYIKTDKLNKIEMKPDDLLIEKSGGSPDQPVGRIAILTEDIVKSNALCYSNFIHKIRVDNSIVIPEYAYFFLKTMYNIGVTESMQSQTNGIRNLIMGEYFRQYILLPEKNKQQQLVNNIKTLNAKAKQLQEEAKEILEKTKQIIEKRME